MTNIILLISCPDRKGIIATLSNFILKKNGNTTYIDQHVDREQGLFFMRLACELDGNSGDTLDVKQDFKQDFDKEIASKFSMQWQLYSKGQKPKMAIFVSKYDHCLYDLLSRQASGELELEIPIIISNHENLKHVASTFGIPFACVPVSKKNKEAAESKQLRLLQDHEIDFVVLARYMQIVSEKFVATYPNKIINIHHSFLPAFPGAKPYHSAFARGVKIIGATSHYVTTALDQGPIIAQEITRVSHVHSIKDFVHKGRDLEKIVLATAIKKHIQRKVLVKNNRTIIFS